MNTTPTTEDRVWAVLSHLSALAFGMGILLPVIGWSEQRRKSKYASFQCLQALGYQSLGYTVWLLSILLIAVLLSFIVIFAAGITAENETTSAGISAVFGIVLGFIMAGFLGIYLLLPLIAAIACGMGKDFRYPFMGNRLAKYLGYPQADNDSEWFVEDHEERWVAAMGHFSVIVFLWGILVPLTAWVVQGKQSLFLKFQSVQTVAYQGFVTLLYMGAGVIYMFGFMIFLGLTGFEGNSNGSVTSTSMLGLVFLIVTMIIAMLIILIMPLLHILGQWAGYRVLKGDDYHYPFVGRLAERWMANKTQFTAEDGGSSIKGETS